MKTQEQLKMSIMGRVYMAYAMRRVFHSTTIRAFLSIGSLVGVLSFVSILSVLKNASHMGSVSDLYIFSMTAITKTGLEVQLSLVVFGLALLWYARDLVKAHILHSRVRA
jgi:hypothetical protein